MKLSDEQKLEVLKERQQKAELRMEHLHVEFEKAEQRNHNLAMDIVMLEAKIEAKKMHAGKA